MSLRQRLVALAVVLLAIGGSAALLDGGDGVAPETVSDRLDERLSSLSSFEATIVQTVEKGNDSRTVRARVAYEQSGKLNITYIEGPTPFDWVVSNESGSWAYNESTNTLRVVDASSSIDVGDVLFGVHQLGPNATFEGNETLAGDDAIELSYAVKGSELSLLLAGGQPTSQLGTATNNGTIRTRVWVDTDLWLPRKVVQEVTAFDPDSTITIRYEDVSVDQPIPDDRFDVDTSPDPTVKGGDSGQFRIGGLNATHYESRAALAANVSVSVPEPAVPAGYDFESGAVFEENGTVAIELTYWNGSSRIEVVTGVTRGPFFDSGQTVTIGDRSGLFVSLPNGQYVQWQCGETLSLIAGPQNRGTLVPIAESVGCT